MIFLDSTWNGSILAMIYRIILIAEVCQLDVYIGRWGELQLFLYALTSCGSSRILTNAGTNGSGNEPGGTPESRLSSIRSTTNCDCAKKQEVGRRKRSVQQKVKDTPFFFPLNLLGGI